MTWNKDVCVLTRTTLGWCCSAEACSEPQESRDGRTGSVGSFWASGTFETSPDHRNPESVRRHSRSDGYLCALGVGGEVQEPAAPPYASYLSPGGVGRHRGVYSSSPFDLPCGTVKRLKQGEQTSPPPLCGRAEAEGSTRDLALQCIWQYGCVLGAACPSLHEKLEAERAHVAALPYACMCGKPKAG